MRILIPSLEKVAIDATISINPGWQHSIKSSGSFAPLLDQHPEAAAATRLSPEASLNVDDDVSSEELGGAFTCCYERTLC